MCNFQSDKNIFASSYGKISISFHGRDFGEVYKQFEFTNENDLSEKIALLSDDIKNDQYSVSGEIALYDNDTHVSFSSKAF
jgi:hypothetical protein